MESNCFLCPESLCYCIAINLLLILFEYRKRQSRTERILCSSQTCADSSVSSKSLLWAHAVSCNRRPCLDDVWCPFQLYDSGSKISAVSKATHRGQGVCQVERCFHLEQSWCTHLWRWRVWGGRSHSSCLSSRRILLGCLSFSWAQVEHMAWMRWQKRLQKDVP